MIKYNKLTLIEKNNYVPSSCPPHAESAWIARPGAKSRDEGYNDKPLPICGPCMVGLCQSICLGKNWTIPWLAV